MKEAIGNAFILNLVIIFVFIFIMFFAGSLSYTKAFKVKNRIISILEKYEEVTTGTNLKSDIKSEIDSTLKNLGYAVSTNQSCEEDMAKRFKNSYQNYTTVNTGTSTYRYCIAEFSSSRGKYYAVVAYMYFEVPLLRTKLEFPIYGETKIMGLLN